MLFSRAADYGLRTALELAAHDPRRPLPARRLAERTGLPEPTVRKLLQSLTAAGVAESTRGRHGGYRLAAAPASIRVDRVLLAFDPLAPTPCLATHDEDADPDCAVPVPRCRTRDAWSRIDARIRGALASLTLADLAAGETSTQARARREARDA